MNSSIPIGSVAAPAGAGKRALAAAVAAALVAQPAQALMLGEPEVRSYLGRPLDVRIPIEGSGADNADASCFSILPERNAGVPAIPRAQLALEQQGGRSFLRVRSSESVNEPAAMLRVQFGCEGKGTLVRQFGLLIDPMPASIPSAPLVASAPAREVASVQPVAVPVVAAPAPVRAHTAARGTARHHAAARPAHTRPAIAAASTRQVHRGGFMLKLSAPVLDLAPSRNIDDAQRAQLREARALLDADDYTSAMLALRERIDVMQRRMAQLQREVIAARPAAVAANAAPVGGAPSAAIIATAPRERLAARVPAAARQLVDASWWWVLVALLGLAALFLPVWRLARRRKVAAEGLATVPVEPSFAAREGVETGRFVAPPALQAPGIAAVRTASAPAPEPLADDTEQAIRNARDLYNAGDRLQAAGVLRLAIEAHPERVAPWLPLFDLLLRERLATEFAELARGFRALHGASPAWKTVQRAGQQIDPGNLLYREDATAEQQAAA